jgi:hypothetical protein
VLRANVNSSDSTGSSMLMHENDEAEAELKPVSKRRRLLMKHRVEVATEDVIRAEINSYLQVKTGDDVDDDPLIFWKNATQLENLKQLAAVILTRSASSVDVECMFSTMGLILNGKRSRLSSQSADALSFIHDNFFSDASGPESDQIVFFICLCVLLAQGFKTGSGSK